MFRRACEDMHPFKFCSISSITCLGKAGNSHDKIHRFVEGWVEEYDVVGKSGKAGSVSPVLSLMELTFSKHTDILNGRVVVKDKIPVQGRIHGRNMDLKAERLLLK